MADCISCGKRLSFFQGDEHMRCPTCEKANIWPIGHRNHSELSALKAEAQLQRDAAVDAITLTTETAPNLKITKRIEIVTAECAFGMNIFKDLFAANNDTSSA